ncbi:unnamed protein product, partial [Didymodactylos carnosus]
ENEVDDMNETESTTSSENEDDNKLNDHFFPWFIIVNGNDTYQNEHNEEDANDFEKHVKNLLVEVARVMKDTAISFGLLFVGSQTSIDDQKLLVDDLKIVKDNGKDNEIIKQMTKILADKIKTFRMKK